MLRMIGPAGRIVAIDIQTKMLESLRRRAMKAGTLERIDTRLAQPGSLDIADLRDRVDFVLAFAVVHELPSPVAFFHEAATAMKAGARMLFAEPSGHVKPEKFQAELDAARAAGLEVTAQPSIRKNLAAVLRKN
jgi:SAM-dependent methyltransferase